MFVIQTRFRPGHRRRRPVRRPGRPGSGHQDRRFLHVYPITEAVAEEFQKAKKNAIKVTVGIPAPAAASRNSAVTKPTSPTPASDHR